MALYQLYVRTEDKVERTHPNYADSFHAGDVISVVPITHQFGKAELASQEHVIIIYETDDPIEKVAADLCTSIPRDLQNGINGVKRVVRLNLNALGNEYKLYEIDRPRLIMSERAMDLNQRVRDDINSLRASRSMTREVAKEIVIRELKKSLIDNLDISTVRSEDAKVTRPIIPRTELLSSIVVKSTESQVAENLRVR